MKVPLGLLLRNNDTAAGKVLISSLSIKPHLKLPAGTVLFDPAGKSPQPLDQIRQVFDRLKERAAKSGDPKIFMDAVEPIDKDITVYFNNNNELVRQSVLFANVAFSDDLKYPDGTLFRILSTLYPHYYPEPDGTMKYSGIIKMLETKKVQFLNDISLLYNESLLVEYKTVLDRTSWINIREKLNRIQKSLKKEELFEPTSDGKLVTSRPLFTYTKKYLYPADHGAGPDVLASPDIQDLMRGDPEILYRMPNSRQGIFLADNSVETGIPLKAFFKKNYYRFMGETLNKNELELSLKELHPKFLIVGSLGTDKDIDLTLLQRIQAEHSGATLSVTGKGKEALDSSGFGAQPLNILVLIPEKNKELEDRIRQAGFTFIFPKDAILSDPAGALARLKSTLDLFNQPAEQDSGR